MIFDRFFKKGYQYSNTRRHLRLTAAWPVKIESGLSGRSLIRSTADVSGGGIRLLVSERVNPGAQIGLTLNIPRLGKSIPVQAQVVRCIEVPKANGFELGLHFSTIDPANQKILTEAIENQLPPRERSRQQEGEWWRNF
jgi:c-di-GMP-binding flagellar brake protein YcgR